MNIISSHLTKDSETYQDLMMYSSQENHDIASFRNQNIVDQQVNRYSGWGCKPSIEFKWRQSQIEQVDASVYNIRMTNNQHTMLVGTQTSMYVYNCENGIRKIQKFQPHNITWTISDIDISDDSTFAISCSLNPCVSLYDLENTKVLKEFDLSNNNNGLGGQGDFHEFRFFSCKMSADKCALIGGSGQFHHGKALIQFFDITKNKVIHSIMAHNNDINTICFVQREQSSVFTSGSDDGFIKVWDIRALGVTKKPVGILYGHMAGITNIDTRNDGIYICSNSKDQSLKLWDLRSMTTDEKLPTRMMKFDYRSGRPNPMEVGRREQMDKSSYTNHSVCSFRSHNISRTLIRCHFSPKLTTNSDYIISASGCGKVFIYSMHNPEQQPIIVQEEVQRINPEPNLDKIEKQKPNQTQTDDEDWESDSGNNNYMDGNDYYDEINNQQQFIIRDVVWNDNSIIVGDFGSNLKEYKPF